MSVPVLIADRFLQGELLGKGSFGSIYRVTDTQTGLSLAAKCESMRNHHQTLSHETRVLRDLAGVEGVPKVHWVGAWGENNVLVEDLLGSSLEGVFGREGRKMKVGTGMQVGARMVDRLEGVHSRHYVHRDIKPDNFLLSLSTPASLFLIDFGLSKRYCDPKTRQHIPFKEGLSLTGTARYASVSAQMGIEQGRRDDLESVVYVLIYFLKGSLPWMGITAKTRPEKYRRIMEVKMLTPIEKLCDSLPWELAQMLRYTKALKFDESPDYVVCTRLLKQVAARENCTIDGEIRWKADKRERMHSLASEGKRKTHKKHKDAIVRSKTTEKRELSREEEPGEVTERAQQPWPRFSVKTRKAIAEQKTKSYVRRLIAAKACIIY